jgi:hypothetical protein
MLGGSSLFQTEKNQWVKVEDTDPWPDNCFWTVNCDPHKIEELVKEPTRKLIGSLKTRFQKPRTRCYNKIKEPPQP